MRVTLRGSNGRCSLPCFSALLDLLELLSSEMDLGTECWRKTLVVDREHISEHRDKQI